MRAYRLVMLFFLYLVQGIPFGLQVTALPVYMRQQGISLELIGYSSALFLPWMLKFFWAPLVDRFGSSRIGRRKSWILPLLALQSIISLVIGTGVGEISLPLLLTGIGLLNFITATQDIAVDGLAVDILSKSSLGYGSAAQVVGFKAGMVISGGVLVWASSLIGWQGLFFSISLLPLVPMLLLLFFKEKSEHEYEQSTHSVASLFRMALELFSSLKAVPMLLFLLSYKAGETMADIMFKPYLVDSGFTAAQIGLWVGTWGMAFSITGSIVGGILASRLSIRRALFISLSIRVIPLFLQWNLTTHVPGVLEVQIVTILEHFGGGVITTAVFAWMMSMVSSKAGATQYTLLASIEVLGKSPAAWLSGVITEWIGYGGTFLTAAVSSTLVIVLIPLLGYSPFRSPDDSPES